MLDLSCYLNRLTIHDYAKEAFALDKREASGFKQGGIYSGAGTAYESANDKPVPAKARLVQINAGKVIVRWVGSWALKAGWEAAASGAWWTSDNCADRIVAETIERFGQHGDSGVIAREFSNVGYTRTEEDEKAGSGQHGAYWSDMKAVVACQTTVPIKVMIGVGRPVINPTLVGKKIEMVELAGEELQLVILTKWQGEFRGKEFLQRLFLGTSSQFTSWWVTNQLVARRRQAKIQMARRR